MRALITGITGQDGRYLSKLLMLKGYEVYGLIRDPQGNDQRNLIPGVESGNLFVGDVTDHGSLVRALDVIQPQEIYNLASLSHVIDSQHNPAMSANTNAIGPLNLLEALNTVGLSHEVRLYQASSSEMFGSIPVTPQNESTPYAPVSPYGIAKVFAHHTCQNYRATNGIHVSCGILYNHESPIRSEKFVSRKITKAVAEIALGRRKSLSLGNLDTRRDWGYAGDYVEAMWLMLQQKEPDDYVICTGKTASVREFVEIAFSVVGINDPIERYVSVDPRFVRKIDIRTLVGDNSKARNVLGWAPKVSLRELIEKMVQNDLDLLK